MQQHKRLRKALDRGRHLLLLSLYSSTSFFFLNKEEKSRFWCMCAHIGKALFECNLIYLTVVSACCSSLPIFFHYISCFLSFNLIFAFCNYNLCHDIIRSIGIERFHIRLHRFSYNVVFFFAYIFSFVVFASSLVLFVSSFSLMYT